MLSLIAYLVSAFFFLFHAIGEQISDWNMVGWGLFFLVVGHLLDDVDDSDFRSFGRGRRRDIV